MDDRASIDFAILGIGPLPSESEAARADWRKKTKPLAIPSSAGSLLEKEGEATIFQPARSRALRLG
jgi:hypothetical protein